MIRYLSCFSGIEAASAAWQPLGWRCVGVAEVEPFPCAVLAHHYPDVPNLGDVTADDFLQRASALRPDVLVGGPPCQDFSVAGLRAGIGGDRGNLSLRWVEIVRAIRPAYAVTENVPGWLSVNGGHAFGAFLAGLVGHDTALVPPRQCGGRWTNAGMVAGPVGRVAWRVLDAQFFGLAQRRQRVFAVFCPRDGADPAAVLFERKGVQGRSPPRREAGKGATSTLSSRSTAGGGLGTDFECSGGVVARCLNAHPNRSDGESKTFVTVDCSPAFRAKANDSHRPDSMAYVTHALRAEGFDASEDGTGRGTPLVAVPLRARDGAKGVDSDCTDTLVPMGGGMAELGDDCAHALRSGQGGGDAVVRSTEPCERVLREARSADPARSYPTAAVRRLVPEEAEALQGFPRGYTLISYRGKPAADGPRYRSLGNSFAVPVVRWIGLRIAAQEADIRASQQAAA